MCEKGVVRRHFKGVCEKMVVRRSFKRGSVWGCNSDIVSESRGWREWELHFYHRKGWRAGVQRLVRGLVLHGSDIAFSSRCVIKSLMF